jgi:hypothetical protein
MMLPAPQIVPPLAAMPSAWTSTLILLTLIIIFASSVAMFWLLIERWTSRRYWTALADWGKRQGFRIRSDEDGPPPAPFDVIEPPPRVQVCLANSVTTLAQLQSAAHPPTQQSDDPLPASPADAAGAGAWNVLVREIETTWPPTGLRPAPARASMLDLFSLTSFPLLGSTERFVVYGTESTAAVALSRSAARGLLPPDIGLLLVGRKLILEFSSRPFDSIEFERMIVLANQLVNHMPAPTV